jgi:AcrR family transcriptional regulator
MAVNADGRAPAGEPAEPGDSERHDDLHIPRYLQLLWHGEDVSRPGPRPGVDLRTIAAAGVSVADAEGLPAVSMRRVAAELGFTTMALYRYVANKEELLMLVFDIAYGPPPVALAESGDWRDRLTAWAEANRDVILAHPWVLQIQFREPPLAPHQIAWMEVGLDALAATPLNEQEKLSSMLLVDVYVRGQLQLSVGMNPDGQDFPKAALRYGQRLAALIDRKQFPRMTAAVLSGALDDETDLSTDEFEFGLNTVLDGIAARVARRESRGTSGMLGR